MKIYVLEYDFDSTELYENGYKQHRRAVFEEDSLWNFQEQTTYAKERPSTCKNIIAKEYIVNEVKVLNLEDISYKTYG